MRAAGERAVGLFPLTSLGLGVLVASGCGYQFFAVPRLDYVIQLVCVLSAALVLLAVTAVVPGALLLRRAIQRGLTANLEEQVAEARQGFVTLLRLRLPRALPLLEVRWTWRRPRGFNVTLHPEGDSLVERAASWQRQWAEEVERHFVLEDAFGLARVTLRKTLPQRVQVLPWLGRLQLGTLMRALAQGDELPHPTGAAVGDRADMRRYSPGDPLRLVLWKIYARTGELMVRTPEQAISPHLRVAAYLPAADGDEPAAAVARLAVSGGIMGDHWLFSADGADTPTSDVDQALRHNAASANVRHSARGNGAGLQAFCQVAAQRGQRQLLLFVPAQPGPWLARAVHAVQRWQGSAVAWVVTDGVTGAATGRRRWVDLLRIPEDPRELGLAVTSQAHLAEVCSTLQRAGAAVTALDRCTGRVLLASTHTRQRAA
jgi:hypothetical protein